MVRPPAVSQRFADLYLHAATLVALAPALMVAIGWTGARLGLLGTEFGLGVVRSRFGYLCVEGMTFGPEVETVDPQTGEVTTSARRVLPSHFKCPQSGNCLDVENPEVWVYPEGVLDDLTPEELGLTPHSSPKTTP